MGEADTTKELLNCLRVLGRVLPVVFEGENGEFEHALMWKREVVREEESGTGSVQDGEGEPQFVIEDEEDDGDGEPSTPKVQAATPKKEVKVTEAPSLAERLFTCVIDLMFCCGFTLPLKVQVEHHKISYIIWCVPILFLFYSRMR